MNHHTKHASRRATSGAMDSPALLQLSLALLKTYSGCAPRKAVAETVTGTPVQSRHQQQTRSPARSTSAGSFVIKGASSRSNSSSNGSGKARRAGPQLANPEGGVGRQNVKTSSSTSSSSSRRILTKKTLPSGNGGMDNEEQNLIVRVRDVLGGRSALPVQPDFVVLDMLGQGTFGQVFRCQNVETKEIVAIKVIRNHPSYYKQAIVEVQITRLLNASYREEEAPHIVRLKDTFEFRSHLCLVFELLSINVYELIAENNFNGFPLHVTRGFLQQMLHALVQMEEIGVIHSDLKPENILLVGQDQFLSDVVYTNDPLMDRVVTTLNEHPVTGELTPSRSSKTKTSGRLATGQTPYIKVVDFGSACMENETVYSYIQSRFYRSPEVLLGIPYTGAIDLWSLGCIAVEMFLGLPLFPGVSEHDQLRLVEETLGKLPQELLRRGRNVLKFYNVHRDNHFVLKTPTEYARDTNAEVQMSKKYFKYTKLEDMIHAYPHAKHASEAQQLAERERREAFLHFVRGLLSVDPTLRWSARDAMQHPFITGAQFVREEVDFNQSLSGSTSHASLSQLPVVPLPTMPPLSVVAPHHMPHHGHRSHQHQHVYQTPQSQHVWSSPSQAPQEMPTAPSYAEGIWGPSGMPTYASGRFPHAEPLSPSTSYYYDAPSDKVRAKVAPSSYGEPPSSRVYPYDPYGGEPPVRIRGTSNGGYEDNLAAYSPASAYCSSTMLHCKVTPTLSLSSSSDGHPVVPLSPYETIPQPEYESSPYYAPQPPPRIIGTGADRTNWHWGDERSPWGVHSPAMSWTQETIPRHHQYNPAELHSSAAPLPGSYQQRRGKRHHTGSWDSGDTRELRRHEPSYPAASPPSQHGGYPHSHHHVHHQQGHQHRPQGGGGSSGGGSNRTPRKADHKGKGAPSRHRKSPSNGSSSRSHHQQHYRTPQQVGQQHKQHHAPRERDGYSNAQLQHYQQHVPSSQHSQVAYVPAVPKREESTGVCSVEEKFSSVMSLDVATSAMALPI